jgi:hypothetical protein
MPKLPQAANSQLERDKLQFEREKWDSELKLKQSELDLKSDELRLKDDELKLKQDENKRSKWVNPLVIAVFAAAAAAAGNAGVTLISSSKQADLEATRATAAADLSRDQATATLNLELNKAEAARILEVVKTNDPDRAASNLAFLVDAGLIADPTAQKIKDYLKNRPPGTGVALPASETAKPNPPPKLMFQCVLSAPKSAQEVSNFISAAVAAPPLRLRYKDDVSTPAYLVFISDGDVPVGKNTMLSEIFAEFNLVNQPVSAVIVQISARFSQDVTFEGVKIAHTVGQIGDRLIASMLSEYMLNKTAALQKDAGVTCTRI